jgi:hypothetical protein
MSRDGFRERIGGESQFSAVAQMVGFGLSAILRLKSNFLSNLKLIWVVQSPMQKYFAFHF